MSELEDLKAAALAEGFVWGESQNSYKGHLEGEFIVAWTDTAPMSDPKRRGPAYVRPELTCEVGDREYAIGKDRAFGGCSRA